MLYSLRNQFKLKMTTSKVDGSEMTPYTCYKSTSHKWSVKVREASFNVRGSAPWGTPYNGLYGEAPPERGIFFRRQVYERVGILLLVKVYEMGRKICHLGLWKGPIPGRVNR